MHALLTSTENIEDHSLSPLFLLSGLQPDDDLQCTSPATIVKENREVPDIDPPPPLPSRVTRLLPTLNRM